MPRPDSPGLDALDRLLRHVDAVATVQDDVVEALDELRRSAEDRTDLDAVRRAVLERAVMLDTCAADVRRIANVVRHLSRMQRFTRSGWPAIREELRTLVSDHPGRAARRWLDYAEDAAVHGRVEALEWLVREGPLPPGYAGLRRRGSAAAVGLRDRRYPLVEPLLGEGAGPRSRSRHRSGLQRLLARLCVFDGFAEDVDRWLEGVEEEPAGMALRAAAERARGGSRERVQRLLDTALSCDATDLDVVCEATRQAILDERFEQARDIADAGVAALPSLIDMEHDVVRLVDPPSELWLALARRARAEHLPDVEDQALGLAEARAVGGPNETRVAAVVADWRAGGAVGDERAKWLLQAGFLWTQLGEFDRALRRYDQARTSLGEQPDRRLLGRLLINSADAGVRAVTAAGAKGTAGYRRSLDAVLQGMAVPGASEESPWSYGVEYDARSALAGFPTEPRTEHLWHAFRAAARMAALEPDQGRSWADCADAAGALGLTSLAARAARRAHGLGGSSWTMAVWLRAVGEYDAALAVSANEVDPWFICLTASLHLDLGQPRDCARLMARAPIDPVWHWARVVHAESVLLTEGRDAAGRLARRHVQESGRQAGRGEGVEQAALVDIGYLHLLGGDAETAETLLRRARRAEITQDQGAPSYLLGLAVAARGDLDEAARLLRRGLRARDSAYLESWRTYERGIAVRLGLSDELVKLLDDVAASAEPRAEDEVASVEGAVADGVPADVVAECRAAAQLLGAVSDDDWGAAAASLPLLPDHDFWGTTPLENEVSRRRRHQQAAGDEAASAATTGPGDAPDQGDKEPVKLRLTLPASWFADHEDPVATHRIFTRLLPAIRAEHPGLPPVLVSASDSLDQELTLETAPGAVVAAELREGFRTCTDEALAALPGRLRDRAEAGEDGRWWIPESAFGPDDRLPRLLTCDVQEYALDAWAHAVRQPVRA